MRDKLIELIGNAPYGLRTLGQAADELISVESIADHLISLGVTIQRWIPVSERLPEEHDSMFVKFRGTTQWRKGMFLSMSDNVLACVEYVDGTKRVMEMHTCDGAWNLHKMSLGKVTHWMPLPEPPKEGEA